MILQGVILNRYMYLNLNVNFDLFTYILKSTCIFKLAKKTFFGLFNREIGGNLIFGIVLELSNMIHAEFQYSKTNSP